MKPLPLVGRGLVERQSVATDLERDRGRRMAPKPSPDRHGKRRHGAGEGHDKLRPLERTALRTRRRFGLRMRHIIDPPRTDLIPEAGREVRMARRSRNDSVDGP